MSFVALYDLDGVGPQEGEPVAFHWPLYLNLIVVLPWLLVVSLLFRPANLNRHAWLVLAPVIVLQVPLGLLGWALSNAIGGEVAVFFDMLLLFPLGLAAVFLLADMLGAWGRLGAFLGAACILAVVGVVGAAGFGTLNLDAAALTILIGYLTMSVAVLAGFLFAGVLCRKQFRAGMCALWMLLFGPGTLAALIVCLVVAVVIVQVVMMGAMGTDALFMFSALVGGVVGAVFAAFVFAAMLTPFVVLFLGSPLYRERLATVYGQDAPAQPVLETQE